MSLTVDDIMQLERSTRYKEEDIRKWFRSDAFNNLYLFTIRLFQHFQDRVPQLPDEPGAGGDSVQQRDASRECGEVCGAAVQDI